MDAAASNHNLAALHTCAPVEAYDDAHGLFGELYTAEKVWNALWVGSPSSENNGGGGGDTGGGSSDGDLNVGSPTGTILCSQALSPTTFLNSKLETVSPHEMPVEIHNTTSNWTVRVRWIDTMGHNNPSTHLWHVSPSSTWQQYSRPGHFFIFSVISSSSISSDEEFILGAYRPKRSLPSITPHCILVEGGGSGCGDGDDDDDGIDENIPFLLETMFLDESKFDALSIAASEVDHYQERKHDRQTAARTVQMLQTIIQNAMKHPDDEKFHKLRLSNRKIQQFIVSSWGALEMLKIFGFVEKQLPASEGRAAGDDDGDDDSSMEIFLILPTPIMENSRRVGETALEILSLLHTRFSPEFIPDLAPPTPWQDVGIFVGSASSGSNWNNNSRGFISDDEKWARAERISGLRRSGRARKPAPGEAPSSRGKWGR